MKQGGDEVRVVLCWAEGIVSSSLSDEHFKDSSTVQPRLGIFKGNT